LRGVQRIVERVDGKAGSAPPSTLHVGGWCGVHHTVPHDLLNGWIA
jgi:hypothetical protein